MSTGFRQAQSPAEIGLFVVIGVGVWLLCFVWVTLLKTFGLSIVSMLWGARGCFC